MVVCFVVNNIGIACERTRLPNLWGEPFGLALDDKLVAVSPETYPFGVRAGQTCTFAKSLCQGLLVLPYDREAYMKAAESIWNVIAVETSVVEPVSPEVAFAEFTGLEISSRAKAAAKIIVDAIGVDVMVGVGTSKLVARQAAMRSGTERITVPPGKEAKVMACVALSSLPSIPSKTVKKAEKLGVRTLGDVMNIPQNELERQFKDVAAFLRRLAVGQDGSPVKALWPPLAASHAVNFEDEVYEQRFIDHALLLCAEKIASKLVKDGKFCRALELAVESSDGASVIEREELKDAARDPDALFRAGIRLYRRMILTSPLTRIEVRATELTIGGAVQLTLLDDDSAVTLDRRRSLDSSLAHLREKFGIAAVITAKQFHKARRIHLWTYQLGCVKDEAVSVELDSHGIPLAICRTDPRTFETTELVVKAVQNSWCESDWSWGVLSEKKCFRVFTKPDGLWELQLVGGEWRLRASAD